MRVHLISLLVASAALVLLAAPAGAAKDKIQMSMTSVAGTGGIFERCVSSGKIKLQAEKVQIQLKKLREKPTTDGVICTDDDIICIMTSDVHLSVAENFGVSYTVFRGDLKKGNMKIKYDMCAENATLCGSTEIDVRTTDIRVACYEADPAWVNPSFNAAGTNGDGAISPCEGSTMVFGGGPFTVPSTPVIAVAGMSTCG
jgi:hypothetical protein